jgi:predicted secreted protein
MAIVDLTDAEDGLTTAEAPVVAGDELVVLVRESPSTGYRWLVETLPDGVVAGDETWAPPEEPELVGSSGVRELSFRVDEASGGELVLRRRRPWDDPADDDATAVVTLRPEA